MLDNETLAALPSHAQDAGFDCDEKEVLQVSPGKGHSAELILP